MMSPAGWEHGVVVVNLTVPLAQFVRQHELGRVCGAETGFEIATNPDTVRAPDVAFVRRERQPGQQTERFFPGAPDLAVEVLSREDRPRAIASKVADWLEAGCWAVWVVDPKAHDVVVHTRDGSRRFADGDVLDGEPVLPGFLLPSREIFQS